MAGGRDSSWTHQQHWRRERFVDQAAVERRRSSNVSSLDRTGLKNTSLEKQAIAARHRRSSQTCVVAGL
eukprot:353323-Chlamydomonas_euryale.AAC.4